MANTESVIAARDGQPILAPSTASPDDLIDSRRGWAVVAASFFGLFLSMGVVIVYSFGVLASAMAEDLGFSRTQLSSIFMVFSLSAVIAGPVWGALTDRFGGRAITIVSSIFFACLFCALTVLPRNVLFVYGIYAAIGIFASGTLPASYASVVVGWFDKRRGLALGLTMMGIGAGAAAVPPLSAFLLAEIGWRNTFLVYGLVIMLVCVPLMMAFLKPNPAAARGREAREKISRRELVEIAGKVPATWVLAFFSLLTGAILTGFVTSFVPMLEAQGIARAQAAAYQSILGLSLILGRIVIGGLIDRIFAPRVMMGVLCITTLGFLAMHQATSPAAYALSAAGVGLAIGAEVDFVAFLVSRYYVRAAFGTLFALLFSCYMLGASFGPLLIAWLSTTLGSYQPALLVLAFLTALLALSILLLPRYGNKVGSES